MMRQTGRGRDTDRQTYRGEDTDRQAEGQTVAQVDIQAAVRQTGRYRQSDRQTQTDTQSREADR